jgi:hypothetical protein
MGDGIIFPSGGYIIGNLGSGSVTVSGAGTIVSQIGGNIGSGSMVVKAGMMDYKSATYGDFNGTSTYVNIASDSSLDEPKTIAFWCKPDQIKSGANNVVSRGDNDYEIYFHSSTNTWWNYWGTKYSTGLDGPPVGVGVWQHIVCTLDDTTSPPTVRWYKDGILFNTDQLNGTPSYGDDGALNIGRDASDENDWMDGAIREVSLYSTKLTDSQVELLYKNQYVGSPVGLWKLDEGTGTEIVDKGSGGNNGVFTNGSWENPAIKNLCTSGSTTFEVKSGASGSLPRGTFTQARNVNFPGTILHNSGTISFAPKATSIAIYAGGNSFYNVHRVEGDNEWVRQYENMTVLKRLYLNDYVGWGVHNASTLTLGDDTTQCTVDGDQPLQVTAANGKIYGGHETNPAIINNTGGGLTFGANTNLKWLDVKTDEVTGGGGVTVTQDGQMQYRELSIQSGDSYDMNGKGLFCKGNFYMSGTTTYGSGATIYAAKFGIQGTNTDEEGASFITSGSGYQNINRGSFLGNKDTNFVINGANTDWSGNNQHYAGNLRVIKGQMDDKSADLGAETYANKLFLTSGATYDAEAATINTKDVYFGGGMIGRGALDLNGSTQHVSGAAVSNIWPTNASGTTIEGWMTLDAFTNDYSYLYRLGDEFIGFNYSSNKLYMGCSLEKADGTRQYPSILTTQANLDVDFTDGRWHHFAISWASGSSYLRGYVDGKLIGQTAINDGIVRVRSRSAGQKWGIGFNPNNNSNYLDGKVGRVSVWKSGLSGEDIRRMMFMNWADVSGSSINQTQCVQWYEFNDDEDETSMTDMSGSGNTGTLKPDNGGWSKAGTFTHGTSHLLMSNNGGASALYGYQDGRSTQVAALSIGNSTTWSYLDGGNGSDLQIRGPLSNSGSFGTVDRNIQYYSRSAPIVGASSNLTFVDKIFYYFGDGTSGITSGTATTYHQPRPGSSAKVYLQGDWVTNNGIMLQDSSITHLNGFNLKTSYCDTYGGGDVVMDPGSSWHMSAATGFHRIHGTNKTPTFNASGEACAMFNQFSDKNNSSNQNYIDTNAVIVPDDAAFTVSFWYKSPTDLASYSDTLTTAIGFNYNSEGGISLIGTNWLVLCQGSVYRYFNSAPNTDGLWHHMLVYVDPTNSSNIRMWIDGSEESAGSTATGGTTNWSGDVQFGRGGYGAMPVSLADIRFYNAANTPTGSVATLAAINPAINVSGAYADPSNALSAYGWFKLDSDNLGKLRINDTIGTYNSAAFGTAGSPANGVKSGFVTLTGSTTFKAPNRTFPTRVMLQNMYVSGSDTLTTGIISDSSGNPLAYTSQIVQTKGKVVLE